MAVEDASPAKLTHISDSGSTPFDLDIETIEDNIEKAIIKHEYPYKDGAGLEDMGQKARLVRIRCYFYNERYDLHKLLLEHLETTEKGRYELTHPVYGLLKGSVESIITRADDRLQTAEIDLTFVEGKLDKTESYKNKGDVEWEVEDDFIDGQDELQKEIESDLMNTLGSEASSILGTVVDETKSYFEQFNNLSTTARNWVKAADKYVGMLKATLNTIANPANGLIASISYATNLPGSILSAVANTVERYVILAEEATSAPSLFMSSLRSGLDELVEKTETTLGSTSTSSATSQASGTSSQSSGTSSQSSGATTQAASTSTTTQTASLAATFAKYTQIASAQREAVELAAILKADDEKARAITQAANTPSFSALGNLVVADASIDRVLTVQEIEQMLADVRTDIQTAIDSARSMTTLKSMARTLMDHVIEVKIDRDRLMYIEVDNATPLHLICLKYGIPYNMAEQLLLVNRLRHPSFVSGKVAIYAR